MEKGPDSCMGVECADSEPVSDSRRELTSATRRSRAGGVAPSPLPEIGCFVHEGHRYSYELHGRGERSVVLLHGILLDSNMNRRLAASIAAGGFRVVLLDLLGHGRSEKPRHASQHRMDIYAGQVIALLDELGIDRAVIGGVSLGADVALQAAVRAPERVQGLIIEMPVLEMAAPVAAVSFVPLMLTIHYLRPLVRAVTSTVSRLPRPGIDIVDSILNLLSSDPDEVAAVLHGVLLGPVAPTVRERQSIKVPTIVVGHRADLLHPFSDARTLARQIPEAELVEAHSIMELRLSPARLTAEILAFLGRAWPSSPSAVARPAGCTSFNSRGTSRR